MLCKEDLVSAKGILTIVFLSMVVATGIVNTFDSFASDTSRIDIGERIGHGGSTYQSKFIQASDCRVVREERLGHGGSMYQLKSGQFGDCQIAREGGKKEEVAQRIGHGGSIYSSSQTMSK